MPLFYRTIFIFARGLLIDKLQEFLLELGRGFCFVARQKLMRYEDEDFYLDYSDSLIIPILAQAA